MLTSIVNTCEEEVERRVRQRCGVTRLDETARGHHQQDKLNPVERYGLVRVFHLVQRIVEGKAHAVGADGEEDEVLKEELICTLLVRARVGEGEERLLTEAVYHSLARGCIWDHGRHGVLLPPLAALT